MVSRPQLVLDVAGVIVSNLSPTFWQKLAIIIGTTYPSIKERFNQDIREQLWRGEVSEEQFWTWLRSQYPGIELDAARNMLMGTLEPLPAFYCLKEWSQAVDIHLLSNHCGEWLEPILTEIEAFTKSITISNQVGCCKPDITIYHIAEEHFTNKDHILYVDDQDKNLVPAKQLGWQTLLADDHHNWIQEVESILEIT